MISSKLASIIRVAAAANNNVAAYIAA